MNEHRLHVEAETAQSNRHQNPKFTADVSESWERSCGGNVPSSSTSPPQLRSQLSDPHKRIGRRWGLPGVRAISRCEPTSSGAEREHGRLTLARWTPSHHQHLVETGGLQLWQPQGFLAARNTDRVPASHYRSHFINLTHTNKTHGCKRV